MAFTPPPPVPQRGARATFSGAVDAFLKWMAALPAQLDAFLARLETIAAGGAYAIPYTFTPSAVAGAINTTNGQNQEATAILTVYNVAANGADVLPQLLQLNVSSSGIKSSVRLTKVGDPSRYLVFNVTGRTDSGAGYQTLQGAVVQSSSANPFAPGDSILLHFQRTGDKGDVGNADKKVQTAPAPVGGVVTVDYRNGNCLKWSPASGATVILSITNWPATGTLGEFWIIGNGLGSATVKLNVQVNWLRPDGTYAFTDSINANGGVTLRPTGEDNVLLWGTNGAVANGKVAR